MCERDSFVVLWTHPHQDLLTSEVTRVRQFVSHALQTAHLLTHVVAIVQERLVLVEQLIRLRSGVSDVQVLGEEEMALLGQPQRHAFGVLLEQAQLIDLFEARTH